MGIGVFYGFFHKKNRTNEEFLMAGRSMSVFPVTLSLICRSISTNQLNYVHHNNLFFFIVYSFISAVTLLGNPVEVYYYGLVYIYFSASFIPMTLAVSLRQILKVLYFYRLWLSHYGLLFKVAYLYVPVFFQLQLTSGYEVILNNKTKS